MKDINGNLRVKNNTNNGQASQSPRTISKLVNFQQPMVEVEELADGDEENLSASIEQKISKAKPPEFIPKLN